MTGSEGIKSVETQLATLGGGCFWCLEAVFDDLVGVEKVESGYMGGDVADPSYEDVCSGGTGHAEVVQITFDESVVSYKDILEIFFTIHDPTTLNRQGPDVGTQYRSAIFFHSPEQEKSAKVSEEHQNKFERFENSIVTEIVSGTTFYRAEEYHQQYFEKQGIAIPYH